MAHVKQADNRPTHSAPEFRLNRSNGSSSYSMDVFFLFVFFAVGAICTPETRSMEERSLWIPKLLMPYLRRT